ncbi:7652_t:CDS:10 [Diversispora eburnea]|uniref:7652_t:CDS:1 n=1 Tax=Diversispora eburnea TaxID=1213867 RepID=A0A9N9B6A9_9GLOM|nr:7652_t:CDS:10 [Diversispora eburnea]
MVAIHEILKKPPGAWKVVVVDEHSNKILESACKIFDILEEKVTLVENLEKPRQAYQSLDAVYIIAPTQDSISRVIEDYSKNKLYAGAHLCFVSPPDEHIISRLKQSLPNMKSRKDLYIDFHAKEAHVYSFESPLSFFRLFSPQEQDNFEPELRILAKLCVSLGENPLIRYQRGLEADHPAKALSFKLAMLLQSELDQYVKLNPVNPFPVHDPPRPRAILFILDRTIDMYTPLLHEFTYQAMANDLLPIDNGQKYTYNYIGDDGEPATKDAILDESDNIWVDIRHRHMKDCIDKLMKDFNSFLGEHAGFTDKDKAANLNEMKRMLATLPQFQNMKEKFSVHLNIAQECMSVFEKERLDEIANVEQNCSTGYTPDGQHPKTLVEDMVPLLDNPVVSLSTKVRMLMLYIMYKNGILEEDRRKLLAHARISHKENDAINNLIYFGVKLIRVPIKKPKKYRQKPGDDHYEISRYVPKLSLILASENRAGRIIVFIAGGVTYSELRSVYELSAKHSMDVVNLSSIPPHTPNRPGVSGGGNTAYNHSSYNTSPGYRPPPQQQQHHQQHHPQYQQHQQYQQPPQGGYVQYSRQSPQNPQNVAYQNYPPPNSAPAGSQQFSPNRPSSNPPSSERTNKQKHNIFKF